MALKNHLDNFTSVRLTVLCYCLEAEVDSEVVDFSHKSSFHENKSNSLDAHFFSTSIKSSLQTQRTETQH